jgi:hypothetical protein
LLWVVFVASTAEVLARFFLDSCAVMPGNKNSAKKEKKPKKKTKKQLKLEAENQALFNEAKAAADLENEKKAEVCVYVCVSDLLGARRAGSIVFVCLTRLFCCSLTHSLPFYYFSPHPNTHSGGPSASDRRCPRHRRKRRAAR